MISAIAYLIEGIVMAIFCYKIFNSVPGKITKKPFTAYFSWTTFFYSISLIFNFVVISIAIMLSNNNMLFGIDYTVRILLYIGAIFLVQIPLYRYFPKNNKRFILSYLYGLIGIALIIYQFYVRNTPTLESTGFINWHATIVLNGGLFILSLLPWIATSVIFISEFVKSKFKSLKSSLIGFGLLLFAIGGIFQDLSSNALCFIVFSIISTVGLMLLLAGMFYEED